MRVILPPGSRTISRVNTSVDCSSTQATKKVAVPFAMEKVTVPEGVPELWKSSGTPEQILLKVRGKRIVT